MPNTALIGHLLFHRVVLLEFDGNFGGRRRTLQLLAVEHFLLELIERLRRASLLQLREFASTSRVATAGTSGHEIGHSATLKERRFAESFRIKAPTEVDHICEAGD